MRRTASGLHVVERPPVGRGTWPPTAGGGGGGGGGGDPIFWQDSVAPVFLADTPPLGSALVAYSYTFVATGGATFAVGSGALPTGVTLNTTTGVISGATPSAGAYTFTITATNSVGTTSTPTIPVTIVAGIGIVQVLPMQSPNNLAVTTLALSGITTSPGNCLALAGWATVGNITSVSDSAGNTWTLAVANGAGMPVSIWTTTNASPAAITSVSVTISGSDGFGFVLYELIGVHNAAPVDVTHVANGTAALVSSGATAAPAGSGEVAIGVGNWVQATLGGNAFSGAAFTSGAGTETSQVVKESAGVQGNVGQLGVLVLPGAAAQTYSATFSTSPPSYGASWSCAIALLKVGP